MTGKFSLENGEEQDLFFRGIRTRDFLEQSATDQLSSCTFVTEAGFIGNFKFGSVGGQWFASGFLTIPGLDTLTLTGLDWPDSSFMAQTRIDGTLNPQAVFVRFKVDGRDFNVGLTLSNDGMWQGDDRLCSHNVVPADVTFNTNRGRGLFVLKNPKFTPATKTEDVKESYPLLAPKEAQSRKAVPYAVSLSSETCQLTSVSGGKGSSLALIQGFQDLRSKAKIPDGICVTSSGFQEHLKSNPEVDDVITDLEKVSYSLADKSLTEAEANKELEEACQR